GFAIHRQNAPETRDWLAKLTGTTALWQSTDRTSGHGSVHSGDGSRRRVRQFRVGSDTFAQLGRGEAIIYTTIDGTPRRVRVLRTRLPQGEPERVGDDARHPVETTVHPAGTIDQIGASRDADAKVGPTKPPPANTTQALRLFSTDPDAA
ncbi:MAG: hypothetical protein ACRDMJ_09285, partial [Solirubrobacteraceae bacterium]